MRHLFMFILLLSTVKGFAFSANEVFQAAERGDRRALKAFIEEESVSPSLIKDGLPLVFHSKDLKTAQYLLSKGASTNNPQRRTMLMQASALNNTSMIKFFLKQGGNVNAQDSGGWTALFYIASVGENTKALRLLMKAGANVRHQDKEGLSALMLAAERGNPTLVALLLKAGADKTSVNNDKETALMLAQEALPFAVDKPAYQKVISLLMEN